MYFIWQLCYLQKWVENLQHFVEWWLLHWVCWACDPIVCILSYSIGVHSYLTNQSQNLSFPMQSPAGFHEGYSVIFLVSFYSGLGINVCVCWCPWDHYLYYQFYFILLYFFITCMPFDNLIESMLHMHARSWLKISF